MSFNLPNGKALFSKLNLAFSTQKVGLVGNNGVGKSTLIKLIARELHPSNGSIQIDGTVAYIQQNPSFNPELTVAKLLGYEEKLNALNRIEQGSTDPDNFVILNDDWLIKEKLVRELTMFDLDKLSPLSHLSTLSGGELTKLMLTKAFLSNADFLLLDEPTNHLDSHACKKLYEAILKWQSGLIVVSHDRALLNLMDEIAELSSLGLSRFGGNYNAYKEQKDCLVDAKQHQLLEAKNSLEKIKRSILACTLKSSNPPKLLILDEPTNHLDLNSMKSIESTLKNYQGAMIVISHDQTFLESIAIERIIYAPFKSIN
jgi:ATPase subunit of ABC transporter with duplicated ATPase domains